MPWTVALSRLATFLMGGSNKHIEGVTGGNKSAKPDVQNLTPMGKRRLPPLEGDNIISNGDKLGRRRSATVQFDTRPPEIIGPKTEEKKRLSEAAAVPAVKSVATTPDDPNVGFSAKNNPRARILKLVIILALPTVVVFAQVCRNLIKQFVYY